MGIIAEEPGLNEFQYRNIVFPPPPFLFSNVIIDAIRRNYYEREESDALPHVIRDGDIILELGGGIGLISTLCAKDGRAVRIFSFEGDPRLCDYMRQVHKRNGVSVDVMNAILMPRPKERTVPFYISDDFWSSSTLKCASIDAFPVEVRTADFQFVIDKVRPTLIIVDIEGGEYGLFDGIDLTPVERILIEFHSKIIGRRKVRRTIDILQSSGFTVDLAGMGSSSVLAFYRRG